MTSPGLWTGRASAVRLRTDRRLWPIFWSLDDDDSAVVALNRENFEVRRNAARAQRHLLGHGGWNGKTRTVPEASTRGEMAGLLLAERPKKWSSSGRSSVRRLLSKRLEACRPGLIVAFRMSETLASGSVGQGTEPLQ